MILRYLLYRHYLVQWHKRLFTRGNGKYWYDYYLDCCLYLLSQKKVNYFTFRKQARSYANKLSGVNFL